MVDAGSGLASPISISVTFQMLRSALSLAGGKWINDVLPDFGSKARLGSKAPFGQSCGYFRFAPIS
jgi:hypothetical protein